jgi:uncharacterized protein (TIGR03067 family)
MIRIVSASLMIACALVAISHAGQAPGGQNLQGNWLLTKAELAGEPLPDKNVTIKLMIKGNDYTVMVDEKVDKGTVKIDESAKPKTLDITGSDGPNKGKTILAIYELDGDMLKVCYNLDGKNRPTEFKTAAKTQLFLATYKRDKK